MGKKMPLVELLPLPTLDPVMLEMQALMEQARAEILKSFLLPPDLVTPPQPDPQLLLGWTMVAKLGSAMMPLVLPIAPPATKS